MEHLLQGAVELSRVAFGKGYSGKVRVTPEELHIIKVGERIPNATVVSLFSWEMTMLERKARGAGIEWEEVSIVVGRDDANGRGKVHVGVTPSRQTDIDNLVKAMAPWALPVSIDTRPHKARVCFTLEDEETTLAVDYYVTGGAFPVGEAENLLEKFGVGRHRFTSTLRAILDKWPLEVYSGPEDKYIRYSP